MGIYDGVTRRGLCVSIFASIGALMFGLDNGWWGSALGLTAFNQDMGSDCTTTDGVEVCVFSTSQQSLGTGIQSAGIIIACLFASYFTNSLGRKRTLVIMALLATVGILVELTISVGSGRRYGQFVAGKFINSLSMGLASNVIPVYLAECAPPKARAALTNLYQAIQIVGVIIAAIAVWAVSDILTPAAYLIPIGLQIIPPAIILAGVWWLPESPRWLVWHGRYDEAVHVCDLLFRTNTNGFDAIEEVAKLREAYEEDLANPAVSTWADIFKGPDLRRLLIAVGVQCLLSAQGAGYMTNYIVSFLYAVGVTDVFKIVMILYCLYLIAICFAFVLPDLVGRRPTLLWGSGVCATCLLGVAAINTAITTPTPASEKASIALIFIWYFSFGAWCPLAWITSSEMSPTRNRERVMAVAVFAGAAVGLVIQFVSPFIQDAAYGNLGSSIGFIYGGFSVMTVFFTWFCVPELKGRSLEQVDYLFEQRLPTRKFPSVNFVDNISAIEVGREVETVTLSVSGTGEKGSEGEDEK